MILDPQSFVPAELEHRATLARGAFRSQPRTPRRPRRVVRGVRRALHLPLAA